jgi:hypothetical protein
MRREYCVKYPESASKDIAHITSPVPLRIQLLSSRNVSLTVEEFRSSSIGWSCNKLENFVTYFSSNGPTRVDFVGNAFDSLATAPSLLPI